MIVSELQNSLQAEQLADIQFTVGAAVVVSCLCSCLDLAVSAGNSLSLCCGGLSLSEDRETKEEEEQIIIF